MKRSDPNLETLIYILGTVITGVVITLSSFYRLEARVEINSGLITGIRDDIAEINATLKEKYGPALSHTKFPKQIPDAGPN